MVTSCRSIAQRTSTEFQYRGVKNNVTHSDAVASPVFAGSASVPGTVTFAAQELERRNIEFFLQEYVSIFLLFVQHLSLTADTASGGYLPG